MNEVWKYDLPIMDEQVVAMPSDAELLHVASQYGYAGLIELWVRCNPDKPKAARTILIRGTGHPVGDEPYVGSVVVADGALVWHVFDGGEETQDVRAVH